MPSTSTGPLRVPNQPNQPARPSQPVQPVQPAQPVQPVQPYQPARTDDPTPVAGDPKLNYTWAGTDPNAPSRAGATPPPGIPVTPVPVEERPPGPRRGLGMKIAAGALGITLLGGAGYAVLHNDSTSSTASATTGTGTGTGTGDGSTAGGPAGLAVPVSGTITAVSSSSITVKASDGTASTYSIAIDAAIENDGATATSADLAVGDPAVVFTGAAPGANSASSSTAGSSTAHLILAGTSATQAAQRGPGGMTGAGSGGGAGANGSTSASSGTTSTTT